jgi:hypothetical protein
MGEGLEGNKINRVSLEKVCRSKEGGLGVKNLYLFHLTLQSKWLWRCVAENDTIWSGLMKYRYSPVSGKLVRIDSLWRRYLCSIGKACEVEPNWFTN